MRSKPVAKDLRRRSPVVQFSHLSPVQALKPLMASALFGLVLASALSANAAQGANTVGTIPGSAGVSATGAATYTIPISLPPGTNGMQPSLALVYNSQSGDGLAGYGWTLAGLSAITRCPWTIDDGGVTRGVQFGAIAGGSSDKFCLDGQRLLQNATGTYGADGMTYSTTINNYAVIKSVGYYNGSPNSPDHFTVQTKDGRVYEYGNTPDSKIQAQWQSNTVRVWALDKVYDLNNNCMSYTYSGTGQGGNGFEYWPNTINYTGKLSGSTCSSFDHEVQFTSTPRPQGSVVAQYQYGNLVTNSQLLQTIQITYSGSVTTPTPTAFQYALGYQQDSANGRNQLISVQECASLNNFASSTCLNPTTISWQSAQTGWIADQDTGQNAVDPQHAAAAHLMDVDGDGIQDLVYPDTAITGDWVVMFGQASGGFTAPVDTNWPVDNYYSYALAGDFNGDGRMDLLVPNSTGWQTLISTGSRAKFGIFSLAANEPPALTGTNAVTQEPIFQGNVWAVDFSGRGLTDVVYNDGSDMYLLKNNGPGSQYSFAPAASPSLFSSSLIGKPGSPLAADVPLSFDGSGRVGAMLTSTQSGTTSLYALVSSELSGTGKLSVMGGSLGIEAGRSPLPVDANGDGLTDLLYILNSGAVWQIGLSTGTGFNNVSSGIVADTSSDPIVADYDNSGRQTAIVHSTNGNWYAMSAEYLVGTGFVAGSATVSSPYPSLYVPGTLRVGNIEANGMDDLVYAVQDSTGNYTWHYALHKGSLWPPDTVTNVTDGLGNYVNFIYGSLASGSPLYIKGSSAAYPIRDIQPAMQVVATLAVSNGAGGSNHYNYTYSGAQTELQGRGFLGFASRTITDQTAGTTETIQYSQTFPQTGMVTSDKLVSNGTGTPTISDTENSGPDAVAISLPYGTTGTTYLPFFDISTTSTYNYNGTSPQLASQTKTTLAQGDFDSFGNYTGSSTAGLAPSTYQTSITDGGSGSVFSSDKTTTYSPGTTNYCVGIPSFTVLLRASSAGTASRTVTGNADTTHCQLNSQTMQDSSDSVTLTTSYDTYDTWGNVAHTTVTGSSVSTPRITAYSFQGGNNEFLTSTTYTVSSSEQLTTQSTWDYSLGFKLSDTDANGKSTNYAPDPFGRLASVTRPDNTQTQYNYYWCSSSPYACPALGAYEETTTQVPNDAVNPAIVTGYTVYDPKGRPVEQGTMLLGGVMSLVDTTYDALGHVVSVTRPHFSGASPIFQTTYTWDDAFNRVTGVTAPANANDSTSSGDVTTYGYNVVNTGSGPLGFAVTATSTSTSSSLTETTTKYTDALGEVTAMVDANGGSTLYTYYVFGDLHTTTDADGNVTTLGYDGLGHKTSMTDPDMGQWGYQVDALGEVLCQTDANNQFTIMVYDGMGRVTNKYATGMGGGCDPNNLPPGTVTSSWSYDQTGALGLPASVSDSNGFLRTYGYDGSERPNNVSTTIPGNPTPYTVATNYDDFSRVAKVTYPVSATPATDSTPTAVATASPNPYALGTADGVTVDGSGSTDPAGGTLQYQWLQTAGSSVPFDAAAKKFSFTPSATGTYSFQLQVIDSESTLSAPTSISVAVNATTPGAPTALSPNYTGTVSLSWSSVAGGVLYKVYESTDGTHFSLLPNPVTGTSTSIPSLTDGNYYFEIQACDSNGNFCSTNGPASSAITVLLPPSPPTGLTANPPGTNPNPNSTGSYTLSWTAPVRGPVTSYQVYQAPNTPVGSPTGSTSLAISGKADGTYTYFVIASNAAGPSTGSADAVVVVLHKPNAPTSVSVGPSPNATLTPFTLSWSRPSSGSALSYYQVNGSSSLQYNSSTFSATYQRPALGNYTFYVQACNNSGCGPNSATVTEVINSSGTGCKTCIQTAPGGGTTAAPVSSTGGGPTADIMVPAAIRPLDLSTEQQPARALAPMHIDSTVTQLKRKRLALVAAQPKQLPESVLQARATRRFREQQPALLPPAPSADVAAYNATQLARLGHDPRAPAYDTPTYIAYGNAHVASATGTPYQFAVTYNYDPSSGALESVTDASTQFIYWRVATDMGPTPVDAFGHLYGYVDGNNISTVTSFDAATGVTTGISTGIQLGTAIQQLAYAWDGFGNLQQRCDVNRSMVEQFTYDKLNRLYTSAVTTGLTGSNPCPKPGTPPAGGTAGPAIHMAYTNSGNIQTLTNSVNTAVGGTYTYDPNHAHAVSTVTNIPGTNAYDSNGNMVCRFGTWNPTTQTCTGGTQIIWNTDNLPTQIIGPNGSSSFNYGPDLQRYAQTETDASGNVTNTTYIGSLFEIVSNTSDTYYHHNIMAEGGVVAIHSIDQNGVVETDYIHSDHLGSGDVITDDTGNIATDPNTHEQQIMSFDAFGLRRDPTNWSYDLTATQIGGLKAKTDRGYTYQEQLDNVSLVHMNGRVYDPSIGRMISADPTVPDPLYSQSFNRYAYVYNNPLNATDPSGFASYAEPSFLLGPDGPPCPACNWLPPWMYQATPPNILPTPPIGIGIQVPLINQAPVSGPPTPSGNSGNTSGSSGGNGGNSTSSGSSGSNGSGKGNNGAGGSGSCSTFGCDSPDGGNNGVIDAINQTDGGEPWDGVCFGCGSESSFSFNPELQDNQIPALAKWDQREATRQAALNNVPHTSGAATGPIHLGNLQLTGGSVGTVSAAGINFIAAREGFSQYPYADPVGSSLQSVGYGHQILPGENYSSGISIDVARQLLVTDVAKYATAVAGSVQVGLTQPQFDALVSFTYNVGITAFQQSTLLRELNMGNYQDVANQMGRWIYSGGLVSGALIDRRRYEESLFSNGSY